MSDIKHSVDPVSVLLGPGERSPVDKNEKFVAAGLVGLAYLAREAVDEKRHKQCLEATKAILKIDPDHKEARQIQSAVRTRLDEEFVAAQTLARHAQLQDDPALYERAAASLRRIIDVDPDNLEARTLLQDTVAAGYFRFSPSTNVESSWRVPRRSVVVGAVAVVVLVGAVALVKGTGSQFSALLPKQKVSAASAGDVVAVPPSAVTPSSVPTKPIWAETTASSVRIENSDRILQVATPAASPSVKPAPVSVTPVALARMGALAVSAAVPVEIYRGEENLGSTPATLQLAEGPQTLEYRYQGLRQTLTHIITREQTTTATVSFQIKVQINAQPWAQVFLDGVNLTQIGQTPLGDISVPIGGVLVFQSPGFPDKRYRVTARDTAIQVNFQ